MKPQDERLKQGQYNGWNMVPGNSSLVFFSCTKQRYKSMIASKLLLSVSAVSCVGLSPA